MRKSKGRGRKTPTPSSKKKNQRIFENQGDHCESDQEEEEAKNNEEPLELNDEDGALFKKYKKQYNLVVCDVVIPEEECIKLVNGKALVDKRGKEDAKIKITSKRKSDEKMEMKKMEMKEETRTSSRNRGSTQRNSRQKKFMDDLDVEEDSSRESSPLSRPVSKRLFSAQDEELMTDDEDDAASYVTATSSVASSLSSSTRRQTKKKRTSSFKKIVKKYPENMEDIKDFPHVRRLEAVDVTRLDDEFIERAEAGQVSWRLYYHSPGLELHQYNMRVEEEKLKRRSNVSDQNKSSRSRISFALSDSSSSGHKLVKKKTSKKESPGGRESPREVPKFDYSESDASSPMKENSESQRNGIPRSTHSMTTRKKRGHLQMSYIKSPESIQEKKVINSLFKKGENESALAKDFKDDFKDLTIRYVDGEEVEVTPEQRVLAHCTPNAIHHFDEIILGNVLENIVKIGEGNDGEVFLSKNSQGKELVFKIVPLDYGFEAEDEDEVDMDQVRQEAFAKVLPELIVCDALNGMRKSLTNETPNFIHMKRASCVTGKYPQRLVEEWDAYNKRHKSQNWHPNTFMEDHIYIITALNNGGVDLESFLFANPKQVLSVILQMAFSLAAAEVEFEFEHRDLHWGNVLIKGTDRLELNYLVDSRGFRVPTEGVIVSIIDFSLSRVLKKNAVLLYQDLSQDEDLFSGSGDPQFDVYRKMREFNGNEWEKFHPKTNIFWLDYLIKKILDCKEFDTSSLHYKQTYLLQELASHVIDYDSAQHLVESPQVQEIVKVLKDD